MNTVYIPVEVKARELTAKLVLANSLVQKGFGVVIGSHSHVRDLALQDTNGAYIEKDFFYRRTVEMGEMKKRGFHLYAYDEEGLVYLQKKLYIDTRTHEDMFDLCDGLFTWGSEQHKIITDAYPQFADKFTMAGNPRIDILTSDSIQKIYRRELAEIKKIGPFILFNSNFTSIDNPEEAAKRDMEINRSHGKEDRSSQHVQYLTDYLLFEKSIFNSVKEAILELARKTKFKVVIRAHPAESPEKWEELAKQDNVIISSKYDANPWIFSCNALMHHGCTTAVEGYIMGKPVIAYCPGETALQIESLPNAISDIAVNKEELIEKIKNIEEGKYRRPDTTNVLDSYIYREQNHGVAIKKITEQIVKDFSGQKKDSEKQFTENYWSDITDPFWQFKNYLSHIGTGRSNFETKRMVAQRLSQMVSKSDYAEIKITHIMPNVFFLSKRVK